MENKKYKRMYKKMYKVMAKASADAIDTLKEGKIEVDLPLEVKQAMAVLQVGQRVAEDMYIEDDDDLDEDE